MHASLSLTNNHFFKWLFVSKNGLCWRIFKSAFIFRKQVRKTMKSEPASSCTNYTSMRTLPIFIRVQLLSICWLAWRKYRPSVHIAACCSVTMAVPEQWSRKIVSDFVSVTSPMCYQFLGQTQFTQFSGATLYSLDCTSESSTAVWEWVRSQIAKCADIKMKGEFRLNKSRTPLK